MRDSVWAVAAAFILAGPALGERCLLPPVSQLAPKRPVSLVAVADAAEPPMAVEASYAQVPLAEQARQAVAVAGGARGTTLTLNTPGGWQGAALVRFRNMAPPMRFTMRLMKMPSYDLQSLTLASGSVSLAVGQVSASATTKYFDARGRAQDAPEGAAYTVTARRWDGEVEVQVRRARGASLGKDLAVSWKSNIGYDRGGLGDK